MINNLHSNDAAALVLRVSLGIMLLAHSVYLKLVVFSLPGTAEFFSSIGLPALFAYGVFAIEAIAGIALILGIYSSFFAMLTLPVMLGALWAHSGNGWLFSNSGGGWEYPLFLVAMLLVQILLGDGKYAVGERFKAS